MNSAYQNFISDVSNKCKTELDIYGDLAQINVLWAGSPNYDALITQIEIDTVPSFLGAGLTTQQLADATYALEQIRTILTNALPALTVLANLP
jgi:hypothetical protein